MEETKPLENQQTPVQITKKGASTKLLIAVFGVGFLFLLTALVVGLFLLSKDSNEKSSTADGTQQKDDVVENNVEDDIEEVSGDRRIAYIKNHNVWVMNVDGTNKTQITNDGDGSDTRYNSVVWKGPGELSYAKCEPADGCKVHTYNLASSTESIALTPPPFTQGISGLAWSHDGETLGYIITKADYSTEAFIMNEEEAVSLASFATPPGRGAGYGDGMEILFSQNDGKVIVFNTIQPFNEDTLIVFDIDGTMITSFSEVHSPAIDSNSGVYYVDANYIKKYTYSTDSSINILDLGDTGGYGLEVSPDGNFISFWYEGQDGTTKQLFHDVAGSPALISEGFANGKWIDSEKLVATKTEVSEVGMGYISDGIYQIDRVSGASTVLDSSDIYEYMVEPLE